MTNGEWLITNELRWFCYGPSLVKLGQEAPSQRSKPANLKGLVGLAAFLGFPLLSWLLVIIKSECKV